MSRAPFWVLVEALVGEGMPVLAALRRHPRNLGWLGFKSWNTETLGLGGTCRSWEASGRRQASVCACSSWRSLALVSFPPTLDGSFYLMHSSLLMF